MRNHPIVRLLPALALACPVFAQEPLDLRIPARAGAEVWLVQRQLQQHDIDLGGQFVETGHDISFTTHVKVAGVDEEGVIEVELRIVRAQGSMKLPMMGDIAFDSAGEVAEDDEAPIPGMGGVGKAVCSLAGKSFRGTISPHGRLTAEIEGAAEALQDARKMAGGMGAQLLSGLLVDGLVDRLAEGAFGLLPTEPVAVGAVWDRDSAPADGGGTAAQQRRAMPAAATKMKLTLASADDDEFAVSLSGAIELPAADAPSAGDAEDPPTGAATPAPSDIKIRNGELKGSQRVSRRDGFTIEFDQNSTMEIDAPSPMGGEMSMVVKSMSMVRRTTEAEAMPAPKDGDAKKQ